MTTTAVVTGASSGMGLFASVELAKRGLDVVATVRDTLRDTLRAGALLGAAEQVGVSVQVAELEVTAPDAADRLAAIAADHDGIDVLINNAGRGCVGTAEDLTMEEIEAQLAVNYLGPVRLTKAVLPAMRERGQGRILTVTSVGGVVGQPFAAAQQAADAGRAIADAATSDDYRFRWQTSEAAERFAGISLADLDGSRVHGVTAGWIASS